MNTTNTTDPMRHLGQHVPPLMLPPLRQSAYIVAAESKDPAFESIKHQRPAWEDAPLHVHCHHWVLVTYRAFWGEGKDATGDLEIKAPWPIDQEGLTQVRHTLDCAARRALKVRAKMKIILTGVFDLGEAL